MCVCRVASIFFHHVFLVEVTECFELCGGYIEYGYESYTDVFRLSTELLLSDEKDVLCAKSEHVSKCNWGVQKLFPFRIILKKKTNKKPSIL